MRKVRQVSLNSLPTEDSAREVIPGSREHIRRMRIRLAALRRHEAAKDPVSGKSSLAVKAGKISGQQRRGDRAWGLENALNRWYPKR